jgi:hypothetical protein
MKFYDIPESWENNFSGEIGKFAVTMRGIT